MDTEKKRSFSYPLYILTFLITVVIFVIGIYVGTLIDQQNVNGLSGDVAQNLQRLQSTQLLFFLDDSASFCPVYANELEKLEADTNQIGEKLKLIEDKGVFDLELKKQYFILEAQSYLLSKKVKEKCITKDVLVLYFYSNTNCAKCKEQGTILLQVRDETLEKINYAYNIKFYSFDGDIGSPIAESLKQKYNISVYPTIILNERTHEGFQDTQDVTRLLQ